MYRWVDPERLIEFHGNYAVEKIHSHCFRIVIQVDGKWHPWNNIFYTRLTQAGNYTPKY